MLIAAMKAVDVFDEEYTNSINWGAKLYPTAFREYEDCILPLETWDKARFLLHCEDTQALQNLINQFDSWAEVSVDENGAYFSPDSWVVLLLLLINGLYPESVKLLRPESVTVGGYGLFYM